MKNKKKSLTPRLPMEEVLFLRSRGGAQTSKKGKKGYNRKAEKQRQVSNKDLAFFYTILLYRYVDSSKNSAYAEFFDECIPLARRIGFQYLK